MTQDQSLKQNQAADINQQSNPNVPVIPPPQNKIVERKVHIKVVEEVSEYDFPQATKTWQALEAAGIDPGSLVANALEQGHEYKSNEMLINQPFVEKTTPVGESAMSEDRLVGYSYVNSKDLKLLSNPQTTSGLKIVLQSRQVALVEADEPKAVKMTAVLRKQPLGQIAPNLPIKKNE